MSEKESEGEKIVKSLNSLLRTIITSVPAAITGGGIVFTVLTNTDFFVKPKDCKEYVDSFPCYVECGKMDPQRKQDLVDAYMEIIEEEPLIFPDIDGGLNKALTEDVLVGQITILADVVDHGDVQTVFNDVYRKLKKLRAQENNE